MHDALVSWIVGPNGVAVFLWHITFRDVCMEFMNRRVDTNIESAIASVVDEG